MLSKLRRDTLALLGWLKADLMVLAPQLPHEGSLAAWAAIRAVGILHAAELASAWPRSAWFLLRVGWTARGVYDWAMSGDPGSGSTTGSSSPSQSSSSSSGRW
jgi:hypothetical protein